LRIDSREHARFIADRLIPADTQGLLRSHRFPRALQAYCGQIKLLADTQSVLRTDEAFETVPAGFSTLVLLAGSRLCHRQYLNPSVHAVCITSNGSPSATHHTSIQKLRLIPLRLIMTATSANQTKHTHCVGRHSSSKLSRVSDRHSSLVDYRSRYRERKSAANPIPSDCCMYVTQFEVTNVFLLPVAFPRLVYTPQADTKRVLAISISTKSWKGDRNSKANIWQICPSTSCRHTSFVQHDEYSLDFL